MDIGKVREHSTPDKDEKKISIMMIPVKRTGWIGYLMLTCSAMKKWHVFY